MKLVLLISFALLGISTGQEVILESPILTYWGDYHPWENCSEGEYVFGMQLKNHEYQGPFYDDTALNGIRFFCGPPGWTEITESIESGSEFYGVWGQQFLCPTGGYISGFQLRSEEDQNLLDDSAANNLRMFCNGEQSSYMQGDGLDFGVFTTARHCPAGQAFCGISTQVEIAGTDDDTSLNNFMVKCCAIPSPAETCKPTEKWEKIQICDNSKGNTQKSCKFEKRVGVSYSHKPSSKPSERQFYENAGYSIDEQVISTLSHNIQSKLSKSSKTIDWQKEKSFYVQENAVEGLTDLPANSRVILYQAVSDCGIYSVMSNKLKKVVINNVSKSEIATFIDI